MGERAKSGRFRRPARLAVLLGAAAVLSAIPFAGSALADEESSGLVPGTPCAVGTAACVLLGQSGFGAKTWLIRDGKVVRGPMAATTGGPGKDTPTGSFKVLRKERFNTSSETFTSTGQPSPMPWSVFFTASGVAFHGGGDRTARTAGCIRMGDAEAANLYETLQPGETVQVVKAGSPTGESENKKRGGGLLGGGL